MTHLGLVDLVTLVLVGSSVVGALVARRGPLNAVLSGVGTAVFCWLVCLALVAWAPATLSDAAASSALLGLVPVPSPALEQARALAGWVGSQYETWH